MRVTALLWFVPVVALLQRRLLRVNGTTISLDKRVSMPIGLSAVDVAMLGTFKEGNPVATMTAKTEPGAWG